MVCEVADLGGARLRSPMDEVNGKIEHLLYQLSQEGLLNDQFQQLMQLQDESNPDFVKVGTKDSGRICLVLRAVLLLLCSVWHLFHP